MAATAFAAPDGPTLGQPAIRARTPDTGLVRPYRPRPDDFRQTYIQMGWDGIVEHYNTNWRVIRRWIIEEGAADLRAARAAYVAANGRKYLK